MIRLALQRNSLTDQKIFSKIASAFNSPGGLIHTSSTLHSTANPSSLPEKDPFTAQLQKKTEDDLRQLIQAKGTSGVNEPIAKHNNIVEEEEKHKEQQPAQPDEIGGVKGPEPTRYGDWEKNGRCSDF